MVSKDHFAQLSHPFSDEASCILAHFSYVMNFDFFVEVKVISGLKLVERVMKQLLSIYDQGD